MKIETQQHVDGLYFKDFLLDQRVGDVNADGYLDLTLTGTAICAAATEPDSVRSRPIRSVFIFDPHVESFINTVPDQAVYVFTVEKNERSEDKQQLRKM